MNQKFERYHEAQSWFAKSSEIHGSSRAQALEIICKKIAEMLEIQRVGIWFYTINKEAIYEEMTYVLNRPKSQGHLLSKNDIPAYFKAISSERALIVNDTFTHPGVREFLESYFRPLNVRALLDRPIFSDGEMIGVLCCEQLEHVKEWDLLDQNFTASCADFIGRTIEAEKRHIYEKELRHRINYLENDLKKKLEDLNEAKVSLDLALESAQVGKWDWDLETNRLSLNATWYTKLGYSYNELPQELNTFKKVLHPDDIDHVFQELDKHLKGETVFYECRFRMITKHGEIQWVLDRGCIFNRKPDNTPSRIMGVNVNVTPMVKWEQSLTISEQQLKAMIQSLPAPVAMFGKDFKYIAYSARWVEEWKFFSVAKEGEIAQNFSFPELVENMQMALKGHIISKDNELVNISGTNYWLKWVIQPWKNSDQEIGGVVIMAENITAKKEAEIRLAQASKLSALGEMAGGIAHEINNPLSIIKGYVDLLRRHSNRKSLGPELLLQYIDKMDQTVGRISKIVSGMRRFSRESSTDEKVKYSLNKIIEETLDICQERINNNGTALDIEYLQNDSYILCRPVEVSQVVLNLINNAFQATSFYTHPWIKIRMEDIGDSFKVSIIDKGAGIPITIRQKLFQPFFTTKEVGTGTGLGLSISRGIIEEHDGKLYYQDDAPHTTFVIELPKWRMEDTQSSH